ncbi:MAG: hypothetical protein U9P71_03395 [Campylobacterota bacterium]|nr:hypothetical protein [Campylobacterota bacterium]
MKILLFTLLLLSFIQAKSISLLLPHQYDAAVHQLNSHLMHAKSHVTLLTPHLQSHALKKSLLALIKKSITVTLITTSKHHMATELVQYENIKFYLLKNRALNFSLIIIDDKFTCKLSAALDEKSMKSELSFFECSDVKYMIEDSKKILRAVTPHIEPYLKENF